MGITGLVLEVCRAVLLVDLTPFDIFSVHIKAGVYKCSENLGITLKLQAPAGWRERSSILRTENIRHQCTKFSGPRFVNPCIKEMAYEKDEFLPRITDVIVHVRNNPVGIRKATSSVVKLATTLSIHNAGSHFEKQLIKWNCHVADSITT
jgi:hypothetical protein